jgi:SAM-dependent methyltransferase
MIVLPHDIRTKFGDDYVATEQTFRLGIDIRFTTHFAERFIGRKVLETCTGGGFTTIALARVAAHVVTVEVEEEHLCQARRNVEKAGVAQRVTFVAGDVLGEGVLDSCPFFDSAFLDPDWAVSGPEHIFRFQNSNMRPPADILLRRVLGRIHDVALVLPPLVDITELKGLPPHERELLFLGGSHELYCLYFGDLARTSGVAEWRC